MGHDRLPLDERIGRRIVVARTEDGLSQAELAAKLDLSAATLAEMEAGYTRVTAAVFYRLSATLGRTISFFFAEDDD